MACLFLSLYGLALIQEVGIIVTGVQGEVTASTIAAMWAAANHFLSVTYDLQPVIACCTCMVRHECCKGVGWALPMAGWGFLCGQAT